MPTALLEDRGISNIEPPVDHDGDDDDRDPIRWITVGTFWQSPAVHIARLKLESEDIPCLITDEFIVSTDWLYASATGGIKLQVPEPDAIRARSLLETVSPPSAVNSVATGVCLDCGSSDIHRPLLQRRTVWAAVVMLMLSGSFVLLPIAFGGFLWYLLMWRPWICSACDNVFQADADGPRGFPVVPKQI